MHKSQSTKPINGSGANSPANAPYGTNERIYTADQTAELLSLDVRLIREQLKAGKLKGYKKHRQWYVLHSDVVGYITGE